MTMKDTPAKPDKPVSGDDADGAGDADTKDNTLHLPPPPKPYTEYTIFFRLERAYLLQSAGNIDEEVLSSLDPSHFDPVEHPRPVRYARLALPPYWYSAAHKKAIEKKRKHRKRAGRLDLQTLSKTVSASWREADPVTLDYCRKIARVELERYKARIKGIEIAKNLNRDDKAKDADAKPKKKSSGVQKQRRRQQASLLVPKMKPSKVASAAPFVLSQAKQQAGNSATAQRPSNKPIPNSNGALSLRFQQKQQALLLQKKKPSIVESATPFALPHAKQQIGSSVTMQRPSNKVALNSNGALSLQDFVFSKPKQAGSVASGVTYNGFVFSKPKQVEKAAPEVTSNGALSLQDLVFSKPKPVANTTMPVSIPAAAAPVTVDNNVNKMSDSFNEIKKVVPEVTPMTMTMSMPATTAPLTANNEFDRMRDSFNEIMGYSGRGLQMNQEHEKDLQVLQFQAVSHQNMHLCGAASSSSLNTPTPFVNARDLRAKCSPASVMTSRPFSEGAVPAEVYVAVRLENRPEKKNKRKLDRRASAPPEFLAHGTSLSAPRPCTSASNGVVTCQPAGSGNAEAGAFLGGDNPKPMKRRSSMIDLHGAGRGMGPDARNLRELQAIRSAGLSDSFAKELDNGHFKHVPKWEKEYADELLDLLDTPPAGAPAVDGNDRASAFDQEMRNFLKDTGMGEDGYCKVIGETARAEHIPSAYSSAPLYCETSQQNCPPS